MDIRWEGDGASESSWTCASVLAKKDTYGARKPIAARLNGRMVDLSEEVTAESEPEPVYLQEGEGLQVYRKTCVLVLAQALKAVYPTCDLAVGSVTEDGFYYDVRFRTPISREDLPLIETEMRKIIRANQSIRKFVISKKRAEALMYEFEENLKLKEIQSLADDATVTVYRQGRFIDVCEGPMMASTGEIKAIRLTGLTGAYLGGNEKNDMLTRIYGTAFADAEELNAYIARRNECKKRDHNRLGRELELFTTADTIGQGLPILLPNGAKIMRILQRFCEDEMEKSGFMPIMTPCISKTVPYALSGHILHHGAKMFMFGEEDERFALRPVTAPLSYSIYKNTLRSYRELPVRYAETASAFRNEGSGELHGLIRLKQFTLSDGQIFCTEAQRGEEIAKCLTLSLNLVSALGLQNNVRIRLSVRGTAPSDKYCGDGAAWQSAEATMRSVLRSFGDFTEEENLATFYGPQIDILAKDVYGREDSLVTIQADILAAQAFGLYYIDAEGEKKAPCVVHCNAIGCYERTLAYLIERYAGAFPLWLAPVQVKIMTVSEKSNAYAHAFYEELLAIGIRAEEDLRGETIARKIREACPMKIPYIVVIGEREALSGEVSVRIRGEAKTESFAKDAFIAKILLEDKKKIIF